jgi:hypothetical protein
MTAASRAIHAPNSVADIDGLEDVRAQVNFGHHGMKWLALGVAKLRSVD